MKQNSDRVIHNSEFHHYLETTNFPPHGNFSNIVLYNKTLTLLSFNDSSFSGFVADSCFIRSTTFRRTIFDRALFTDCDLREASFQDSVHKDTVFSNCNLVGVDFSGAKGLPTSSMIMKRSFRRDELGYIVYKVFCSDTWDNYYIKPFNWKIKEGSFLKDTVNPDRTCECACGVNFATRKWCETQLTYRVPRTLWKCRIRWEDLPDVVIPYNFDGKGRCAKLELLHPVKIVSRRTWGV